MLQIELSLARIMDPSGAPRAGSGLRTRFGWMERRRPHPPARFICTLSGFGLGQKPRRHFNPPWWGSVRSVGHGTITGAMACHRVPAPPRAAARRDRCVARCRRRCASAAPASPGMACPGCGVSTTLSSDGTGSYGDGGSPGSVASGSASSGGRRPCGCATPAKRLPKVSPVMDRTGLPSSCLIGTDGAIWPRSGLPT
jgi:hypothetical protein